MTPGSDTKPTVRLMRSSTGGLVVEVKSATLILRPFRSRVGGSSEVVVNIESVYNRALMQRVKPI
jgi:hypothetical protein